MTYTRFTYMKTGNAAVHSNACTLTRFLSLSHLLTSPGRTGASHMCLPSWVLLTSSINLSGVLTSPLTLSSTFTLSGKAAMSGGHDVKEQTPSRAVIHLSLSPYINYTQPPSAVHQNRTDPVAGIHIFFLSSMSLCFRSLLL